MLSHRFTPYIILGCIVAFFSLAYVALRAYQNHVEVNALISESKVLPHGIEKDPIHSHDSHNHDKNEDDYLDLFDQPPVKVRYADATTVSDALHGRGVVTRLNDAPLVPQIVETPDGKTRVVYTHPDQPLRDGDAIPPLALGEGSTEANNFESIHFSSEDVPEGEDLDTYGFKLMIAQEEGISIEELNRQIASGQRSIRRVSQVATELDQQQLGEFLSELEDVKHSISVAAVAQDNLNAEIVNDDRSSATIPPKATYYHTQGRDTPHADRNVEAAESPKTQQRFNNAQQLIDRYGTEEGLRRLRESDPDAAERFDSDTSRRGRGAPPRSNGSSEQQGGASPDGDASDSP